MADVTDLFKALPYGMFDKRTWSPKARDEFARQLAEEESQQQLHSKVILQGMADSAAESRQKAYLQTQHDLDRQAKDASKNEVKAAIGKIAAGIVRGRWPADRQWNAEEANAEGAHLAEQMAAEWEAADAVKASRSAVNDIRSMATEQDIAPDKAAGEIAQAKLGRLRNETWLTDFEAEREARLAKLAADEAVARETAANPVFGIPGSFNLVTSLINSMQRQPVMEADAAKKTAEAANATAKAGETTLRTDMRKGAMAPKTRPPTFKIVNGDVAVDAPTNAPVTVNGPVQPAGSGIPELDAFIQRQLLDRFTQPKKK